MLVLINCPCFRLREMKILIVEDKGPFTVICKGLVISVICLIYAEPHYNESAHTARARVLSKG